MKTIITSILLTIFFIGCSENNPVGNNNNPPTTQKRLYIIQDSVITNNSNMFAFSLLDSLGNADSVLSSAKITFNAESNDNSNNPFFKIYLGSMNEGDSLLYSAPLSNSYSLTFNFTGKYRNIFATYLYVTNGLYLKLKNIRIYQN